MTFADRVLSTDAASPTNAASVTVAVDFGKQHRSATGGTASDLTHSSANQNFTFDAWRRQVTTIPADRVMDIADNTTPHPCRPSTATTPGPTLSTDAASPTNAASVTVAVDFGKPIDPATFTLDDISATGGTASDLTHSSANQNFTFTLTPGADGEVTATIPADRVMDIADNDNTASNVLRVTFDRAGLRPRPRGLPDQRGIGHRQSTLANRSRHHLHADISVTGGIGLEGVTTQKYTFTVHP